MALEVGAIVASLGATLDPSRFDAWDRRVASARVEATRPVLAQLGATTDATRFDEWDRRVEKASRTSRVEVPLGAKLEVVEFDHWQRKVTEAKTTARDPIETKLSAKVDTSGWDRWQELAGRARATRLDPIELRATVDETPWRRFASLLEQGRADFSRFGSSADDAGQRTQRAGGPVNVLSRALDNLGSSGRAATTVLSGGGGGGGGGGVVGALGSLGSIGGVSVSTLLALSPAILAVVGALGALIGSAGAAAAGVAAIGAGAVAALGPLAALAGAVLVRVAAITEAYKAVTAQGDQAAQAGAAQAQAQTAATYQLKTANQSLVDANRQVGIAEDNLTLARARARREVEDLTAAVEKSKLSEESASLQLRQTLVDLAKTQTDPRATQLARDQATQAVAEARRAVQDASATQTRALEDQRRGTNTVAQAELQLTQAREARGRASDQVAQAEQAMTRAAAATSSAATTAQQKLAELSTTERRLLTTIMGLGDILERVFRPATDLIFGSINRAIVRLTPVLESFQGGFTRLGGAVAGGINRIVDSLAGPEWKHALDVFLETATRVVGPLSHVFESVLTILRDIAVAAEPYVIQLANYMERAFGGLAAKTGDARNLSKVIGGLVDQAKSWAKFIGAVAELLYTVFSGGAKQGQSLVDTMTRAVKSWTAFLDTKAGQDQLRRFFTDSVALTKILLQVLGVLGEAFLFVATKIGYIKRVGEDVFGFVKGLLDDNRATVNRVGDTFSRFYDTAKRAVTGIAGAIGDAFGPSTGASNDINHLISLLGKIITTILNVFDAIVNQALPGIIQAVRGFATVLRGIVELIVGILSGDFGKAWQGVKDIFSGALDFILGALRTAVDPLAAAAAAIGHAIGGAFSDAWGAIKHTATGFVNDIIDVINVIPGVNIKHVGSGTAKPSSTTSPLTAGLNTNIAVNGPSTTKAGQFREGGKITMPIAIMGEEAPAHPEWVIPENPQYRDRAIGLWMLAGQAIGIPGFAQGGVWSGRVSTFGPPNEPAGTTASGVSSALPGIALRDHSTLGKLFDVVIGAHKARVPHTDWGPAEWTGRDIDVTGAASQRMGINPFQFPTDSTGTASLVGGGGSLLGDIASAVGDAIAGAASGAAGFIGGLLPKLPGNPGGILSGTFGYLLGKAGSFIKGKASDALSSVGGALGLGGGGGAFTGTLVPKVQAALAWARSHGWGGSVTSAVRSHAQQQALWDGAPGNGLIRGISVAAPGTSSHERGEAVDVTDIAAFQKAMASAPTNARLLWRGPSDPVHFSVSGHRRGGILGRIGGFLGGDAIRLAEISTAGQSVGGGTRAYKTGGKTLAKTPAKPASRPALTDATNAGIVRSIARGEQGLLPFEKQIQGLEREYTIANRRADLDPNEYLVQHPDGSVTVDQAAFADRAGELAGLLKIREAIQAKIAAYVAAVKAAIQAYMVAIRKLQAAYKAAKGAARSKERSGYLDKIQLYQGRVDDLGQTQTDLGYDVQDAGVDVDEIRAEIAAIETPDGSPIGAKGPDPVPAVPDPGAAAGAPGAAAATAPAGLSAADVAAAAIAQVSAFQAARADLFASDGSNFAAPAGLASVGVTPIGAAAGARFYGADQVAAATDAGESGAQASGGDTILHQTNHFAAPPPDPHTWTQATKYELATI